MANRYRAIAARDSIYSTTNHSTVPRAIGMTVLHFVIASAATLLTRWLVHLVLNETWASFFSAIVFVGLFIYLAPLMGVYPMIFGGKVKLDMSNTYDKKLYKLIQDNPQRLNCEWFKAWKQGGVERKTKMLDEMKTRLV